jgi:L-aspartate oxidase
MWRDVGILRTRRQLLQAAELLGEWAQGAPIPGDRASQELSNMALVGWVMAEAALLRQESRGAHYRSDYPDTSPEWVHHLTIVGGD